MTPDLVRRVLWEPPSPATPEALEAAFAELGARPWQRELVVPVVHSALRSG